MRPRRRLLNPILAWLSLVGSLAISCAAIADSAATYVVLRDVTVIDATDGHENAGMSILIHGERIEQVAPTDRLAVPPGARTVEAGGQYAIPGLINTHEHLATPPNRPYAEAMMRRDLYGGITAVRDMADDLRQVADLARASRVGEIPGPDIDFAAVMAGPAFFKDPRTHAVTAGAIAGAVPWMQAVTAETDLPLAVAMARGTGARAIKIYADLPAPLVEAITREAHRQGMLVWAHAAVFPASPAEVVGAGVDAVSHVCMLAYQVSDAIPSAYHDRAPVDEPRVGPGDNATLQGLFRDMRARGVILDATLWIYDRMAREHAEHPAGGAPYCGLPLAERLTNQAWRNGVVISAGTDGFADPGDPWPALDEELGLLQDGAALTPAAVLRAATLDGAAAMGRQEEMGTIAPGKLADIVLLAQDPLKGAAAYRTVTLTVKRGVLYWRRDFQPGAPARP